MPSPAAIKYFDNIRKAEILRKVANDPRLKPISRVEKQIYYHASLTASVATWDAYINNIVREFFNVTFDPSIPKFSILHTIAKNIAEKALRKFNTPNWENTRNLLVQHTGYDPINDWIWSTHNMGVQQVQERLNQILKVRHSFAHGFAVPAFSWTQTNAGVVRLTSVALTENEAFFKNLVKQTDKGMKQYIDTIYGTHLTW